MIITVTGHRPDKLGSWAEYEAITLPRLVDLARQEFTRLAPSHGITGMALGWDIACAMAFYERGIPYIAAVPFLDQDKRWNSRDRARYLEYIQKAKSVVYVDRLPKYQVGTLPPDTYHAAKMQRRNEFMIDHCTQVLALWDGSSGGTGNAVEYARKTGKPIINAWSSYGTGT